MKISSRTILAAALLTALPMGSALACTITAWNGTPIGSPTAGGPTSTPAVARYSGVCALATNSNQAVVDNTPAAEAVYRARFYVLTKSVSGATTIFKATTADHGGGTNVATVEYNGSAFSFTQNGSPVGSPISGIAADKWYSVEVFYKAGAAFTATVAGGGSDTVIGTVNVNTGIGSATVGSAVLGVSAGTATGTGFDAFVSTRSEDTAIGRLCRGDATGDGILNIQDRIRLNNELNSFGANASPGQPDCNENGGINTQDRICLNNRIANFDSCQ